MKKLLLLCCLGLLGPSAFAQTADEKKQTVAYLQGLQTPQGGFAVSAPKDGVAKPSLRATSSALRALKYFGGEPRNSESCGKFVASCFDKDSGGFVDAPGAKPDVAVTAVGMMAVVELNLPAKEYREGVLKYLSDHARTFEEIRIAAAGAEVAQQKPKSADAWLEQVRRMRNEDGTFGKGDGRARDTGGAVVVLLRLGDKVEMLDNVKKCLADGQRQDSGFGKAGTQTSDLETTYRVLRAFHMLAERPRDVPGLKKFVGRCRNEDGGYGVAPGEPSSASATYFASIILHWLEQ